ncbi:phosphoglucosamine mutase [SAR86 cluster bacterium]|jgi:phosphoglucosamine mutase|nr:phosphoglucosamine mutase [SAR86 cluster bacterium]
MFVKKKKFFGTDGIRGPINENTNPEFVLKLGWAAGKVFSEMGISSVIIGKDTRISGYLLETAIQSGFISAGVDVKLVGPLPTPAISFLANSFKNAAGVVISASHNSYLDNGIKFFDNRGKKLSEEIENKIEKMIDEKFQVVEADCLGKANRISDAGGRYIEFCKKALTKNENFSGLKLVLDVANGAAYDVAPKVFKELGADLKVISNKPDGLNINKDCGSTDIEFLKKAVTENDADFGLALDGDGDRLIFVSKDLTEIDGDQILYLLAKEKFQHNIYLGTRGVVGTHMTNQGLEDALKELDIELIRSDVGDRYVLQKLEELGWELGGEQSGHVICLDSTLTGDGIIAAIKFLDAINYSNKVYKKNIKNFKKYPQVLKNIKTNDPEKIIKNKKFNALKKRLEADINNNKGRINVRKSGTEKLLRIMVESNDSAKTKNVSEELESFAKNLS